MAETRIPPEPDTPLLYLRAIRAILDDHTRLFGEVITRLGRLEREGANLHSDWVSMAHRLDIFDTRLQWIEHRLDLVEEPTPT
jgi:hypothetical protein